MSHINKKVRCLFSTDPYFTFSNVNKILQREYPTSCCTLLFQSLYKQRDPTEAGTKIYESIPIWTSQMVTVARLALVPYFAFLAIHLVILQER